jgi:ferredoxin-NADP reductase
VPDWPGHRAGQHADIRLTAPDGYTAQRSYSIASPPEEPDLHLIVERLETGEVSPYLTDELRAGDVLELRGPIGGYFVWPEAGTAPVQLIAGGSGVAPFLAMLGHHRHTAGTVAVRLLYSVRDDEDLIGRAELEPRQGVEIDLAYTRAAPPGWSGAVGRVTPESLAARTFSADQQPAVFVCGPTGFVETVTRTLTDLGHDPRRIRTERFGGMGANP